MPKRQSAYSQILKEKQKEAEQEQAAQASDIEEDKKPQSGKAVSDGEIPQNSKAVQNGKTVKKGKTAKITIYPTTEQLDKLYDLMEAYRKRTGIKVNQQDIIRRLIDLADV